MSIPFSNLCTIANSRSARTRSRCNVRDFGATNSYLFKPAGCSQIHSAHLVQTLMSGRATCLVGRNGGKDTVSNAPLLRKERGKDAASDSAADTCFSFSAHSLDDIIS